MVVSGYAYPVYSWNSLDSLLLFQLQLCQLEISWLNDWLIVLFNLLQWRDITGSGEIQPMGFASLL